MLSFTFFFKITRNQKDQKVPVSQHLSCFFFGTLYCSNYYSIKSKSVTVVITVVNDNIAGVEECCVCVIYVPKESGLRIAFTLD